MFSPALGFSELTEAAVVEVERGERLSTIGIVSIKVLHLLCGHHVAQAISMLVP
jgi:hypothetical protein